MEKIKCEGAWIMCEVHEVNEVCLLKGGGAASKSQK